MNLRKQALTPRSGIALAAIALAGTALWVRHSAKKAEERFPPAGRFIEIDGVRLHYLEQGAGAPVVLLHGNGARAEDFVACGLMGQLAANHRVIAFDRPGFGHSNRPGMRLWTPKAQARLLAKACLALNVINPVVVGHSMGTQTAFEMAIDPSYSVRGVVVISGYYFPTPRVDALFLAGPAIPGVGHVLRYTVSNLAARLAVPRLFRRFFWPRKIEPAFVDAVPPALIVRPGQLRASAEESAFMVPAAARLARHYGEIDAPVEIFGGEDERVVGQRKQSRWLHEAIPQSRLHLLPGEGHMLHYQVPEQIVEAIERVAHSHPVAGLARRA